MPLIYITGPTGSGKSTTCEVLRARGFKTYDTDDEGMRKVQNIGEKELLTLDVEALKKVYEGSEEGLTFVCGTSPTDLDAQELFSRIIVLEIDETEQKERILNRTSSKYGRQPHQLAASLKWRQAQIDKYKNAGATVVDATKPVYEIVDEIIAISQTL